jgi:3-oxoacyl-[acyl-carrier-protein] synthase II
VNHAKTGADCPIRVHVGSPRAVTKSHAVKISYTDLGQCAVAVVRKYG